MADQKDFKGFKSNFRIVLLLLLITHRLQPKKPDAVLVHAAALAYHNVSRREKTHYDILGVKEDATHEEIRSCYRSAILNSHPDKLQKAYEPSKSEQNERGENFLEIQRAWEILGNLKSRAVYDSKLQASRQDEVTADDLTMEDLAIEDAGDIVELFHQCRCGDYFSIDSQELGKMGFGLLRDGNKVSLQTPNTSPASVVLPCGSCSLKVRLWIRSDTWLQNPDA